MIVDRSEQNWTPLAGLGGLGGAAVANFFSGDSSDPLRGYCDILKQYGDIGVSEFGPGGCQDLKDCGAGIKPSAAPSMCEQSLRSSDGTQWCFIGSEWYPLGIGCGPMMSRATPNMSDIQTGGTPISCAPGWEKGVDNQCHPQGYATPPQVPTQAQVDANKVAISILDPSVKQTSIQTNLPTDIARAMGTGLVPGSVSSFFSGIPTWLLLLGVGGGALLLLGSSGRGR
jgi:hypothetical protein